MEKRMKEEFEKKLEKEKEKFQLEMEKEKKKGAPDYPLPPWQQPWPCFAWPAVCAHHGPVTRQEANLVREKP